MNMNMNMNMKVSEVFRLAQTHLQFLGDPWTADTVHGCCLALARASARTPKQVMSDITYSKAVALFSELYRPKDGFGTYWWWDHTKTSTFTEATQQERFIALELAALIAEDAELEVHQA